MAELPASLLADKDKPTWVKYQEELLSVILSQHYGQITKTLLLLGGVIGKGHLSSQAAITKTLLLPGGAAGNSRLSKLDACTSSRPPPSVTSLPRLVSSTPRYLGPLKIFGTNFWPGPPCPSSLQWATCVQAQRPGHLQDTAREGHVTLEAVGEEKGALFKAEPPASFLADEDKPTWVKNQEELLPVILIHPYGQVAITRILLLLGGIIGKGNLSSQAAITKTLLLPGGRH